jgi:putative hydrolase of the HAD superfamily|tara:strand:- start:14355 stop:14831 length:477 start_codon:yes stop_codon:yes gene_type:complete
MKIPTKDECLSILAKNNTPSVVIEHSKTVLKVAEDLADTLIKKGIKVDKELVVAAALLHDIERAKDNHVSEGAKLLASMGLEVVAGVIKKHSLYKLEEKDNQPQTWEEKIMFYADKRAKGNQVVSLEERFSALEKHYDVDLSKEFEFAKKIEKELVGE